MLASWSLEKDHICKRVLRRLQYWCTHVQEAVLLERLRSGWQEGGFDFGEATL